jgi:hypothetical protein
MAMTLNDRIDVMNKVSEACDLFENDLKGDFYRIKNMLLRDKKANNDEMYDGDNFNKDEYL